MACLKMRKLNCCCKISILADATYSYNIHKVTQQNYILTQTSQATHTHSHTYTPTHPPTHPCPGEPSHSLASLDGDGSAGVSVVLQFLSLLCQQSLQAVELLCCFARLILHVVHFVLQLCALCLCCCHFVL